MNVSISFIGKLFFNTQRGKINFSLSLKYLSNVFGHPVNSVWATSLKLNHVIVGKILNPKKKI